MEAVAAEDYELAASLKKQIAALKTGEQIESSPLLLESSIGMKNMNKKSSADYWTFFGKLGIHESMLQDQARTRAYREAILGNAEAFAGKVVLDVGAGSGILTFFALQAGAAKVVCVEATDMVHMLQTLADKNGFGYRIQIVHSVLQDVSAEAIPAQSIDIIISETLS